MFEERAQGAEKPRINVLWAVVVTIVAGVVFARRRSAQIKLVEIRRDDNVKQEAHDVPRNIGESQGLERAECDWRVYQAFVRPIWIVHEYADVPEHKRLETGALRKNMDEVVFRGSCASNVPWVSLQV